MEDGVRHNEVARDGRGIPDLVLGRDQALARCSQTRIAWDAQQITPVLMRWLRVPGLEDK
jgi:hypothetical protein